jgi:hypothetical protein
VVVTTKSTLLNKPIGEIGTPVWTVTFHKAVLTGSITEKYEILAE